MSDEAIYVPITVSQKFFSLSWQTLYRAVARDEIRIHKRAGKSFLKVSEVCDWIEGREPSDD
ncbi:hypothetical protein [uncultured Ruegeria sp.]|uniref:hypothetical protein n=1 Tax=uncultured Ruegeria sp. TaxID=259304 RepID=UPI002636AE48|nr:hypothetical protein [uncultured Ruegeria sp.]